MRKLFQIEGTDLNPAYVNIRDRVSDTASAYRDFYDALWSKFKHLADRDFESELAKHTQARLWELYLGCALLDMGFSLESANSGPDFSFVHDNCRHWVEAICPTAGEPGHPDEIPEVEFGSVADVPVEKILLRMTSAVKGKAAAFARYIENGTVDADDVCIVAMSGAVMLNHRPGSGEMPYICKALFPIGNMFVTFDRDTLGVVDTGHEYRPQVKKSSGAEVSTEGFFSADYEHLSGLIFAEHIPYSTDMVLGTDLLTIHNPRAQNPMDRGLISRGTEYWVEDDQLNHRNLNDGTI